MFFCRYLFLVMPPTLKKVTGHIAFVHSLIQSFYTPGIQSMLRVYSFHLSVHPFICSVPKFIHLLVNTYIKVLH